jgi:homoserine dehydrogenase
MERVNVGLVGFGTVGGAFYRLMQANGGLFESKFGVAATIAAVAEKDPGKVQAAFPGQKVVPDYRALTADPSIAVIVELVGGTGVAYDVIRGALEAGKHVISANKALLALRGDELFTLARKRGVELRFEGAVCGAIPIIKVVRESLVANRVASILGIVNGTSNFILTRMSERGLSFAEALSEAQAAGFAEADPTLDVGGGDSAHKISLLASFAFGGWIDYRELLCEGITGITAGEIEFASSAGFVFKLLASARWNEGRPAVTVFPALVPKDHPLAAVRGEMNAVMTRSDFMGPAVFVGKGAGGDPTASSVSSDLGDLLLAIQATGGRDTARFDPARKLPLFPRDQLEHRYFFHFITANRPGIWAAVTTRLADNGINIESVHQKWEDRSLPSDLYVLVDEAPEVRARQALAAIRAAPGIDQRSCYYRILAE